jgi:hypothetical protein
MIFIKTSRFMAVCQALNVTLDPKFPDSKISESQFISRANVQSVTFEPLDNCPHVEKLRAEGLIPWATSTIDFLNK